jgi:hypothetical protein
MINENGQRDEKIQSQVSTSMSVPKKIEEETKWKRVMKEICSKFIKKL